MEQLDMQNFVKVLTEVVIMNLRDKIHLVYNNDENSESWNIFIKWLENYVNIHGLKGTDEDGSTNWRNTYCRDWVWKPQILCNLTSPAEPKTKS